MNFQIACVSENTAPWFARVRDLAFSIRRLESPLAEAPVTAHFVSAIQPEFERALADLDVQVRVVPPMPGHLGPANKLRMLEWGKDSEFDVLVALDCDTVAVNDFAEVVSAAAIGLKEADDDRLRFRDWHKLCGAAGLDPAAQGFRATSNGVRIPPYFNSGVITIPRRLCDPLRDQWMESYTWFIDRIEADPRLLPKHIHWFADQIALALAVRAANLPVEQLPVGMNMPTHLKLHQSCLSRSFRPYVLHYHAALDEHGFLLRPVSGQAAREVDSFNRDRAEFLSLEYPGLRGPSRRQRAHQALRQQRRRLRFKRYRLQTRIAELFPGGGGVAMPRVEGGGLG